MPTGRHLSSGNKLIVAAISIVAIIVGASIALGLYKDDSSEPAVTGNEPVVTTTTPNLPFVAPPPTDTVAVGTIETRATGAQDDLYLKQDAGPTTKLVLDEHSYCNLGSGGLPCVAMSITFSTAFGGKPALIDGNKVGDTIVVRRIRILLEDEVPRVPSPGTVYIPWMQARALILDCEVKAMIQTHEGLVNIVQKNGTKVTAVQPVIDEVFKVANEATAACGSIGLGTE